jgi:hypothetical protein
VVNDLRIGGDELSSVRHFKGLIDDVRIYDKALSRSEIDNLFDSGDLNTGGATYRYVRWTVTDRRGSTNSIQASEFELMLKGNTIGWPSETAATNPNGSNPNNEGPAKAIDGGTGKWLDHNFDKDGGDTKKGSSVLVIDTGAGKSVTFDGYRWRTANDFTDRDPLGWKLEGSNDGSSWTLLDERSGESVPITRHAFTDEYELGSSQVLGISTLNDLMGDVLGASTSNEAQLADLQVKVRDIIFEIQTLINKIH